MKKEDFIKTDTGVLTEKRLAGLPGFPSKNHLGQDPIAVLECDQEIPCNPCEDICPNGAISVGSPITNLPSIDPSRCTGCLKCIRVCPGLCVFLVCRDHTVDTSLVYIPYELLPLPREGENIDVFDRYGIKVCKGRIKKVIKKDKKYRTAIIAMEVPKKYYMSARHFRPEGDE